LSGTAYFDFTCATAETVSAVAFANHNFPATATFDFYGGANSGSISQIGTTKTFAGYKDEGWDFGDQTNAFYRVKVSGASGKKIGCVSLLSSASYHKIVFTNAWATYPIGQSLGRSASMQESATGQMIVQRRGGSYRDITYTVRYVQMDSTTAGQEGYIDDAFLLEVLTTGLSTKTLGFAASVWIVDDAGRWFHAQLVPPIEAPVVAAGGRSEMRLRFRTIPHCGLA
jgi:hypothetical protein